MLVTFDSLSDEARIWVYQSNRAFSEKEKLKISEHLETFVESWKRHGKDLKASYKILKDHFIVLAVEESYNPVSGCAIDASVHAMKAIEQNLNLDLTNKMNVSFKDGENINIVSLGDFQKYASQNKITGNTLVYNNMVAKKVDLESHWEVAAKDSWHQRYLTK